MYTITSLYFHENWDCLLDWKNGVFLGVVETVVG